MQPADDSARELPPWDSAWRGARRPPRGECPALREPPPLPPESTELVELKLAYTRIDCAVEALQAALMVGSIPPDARERLTALLAETSHVAGLFESLVHQAALPPPVTVGAERYPNNANRHTESPTPPAGCPRPEKE